MKYVAQHEEYASEFIDMILNESLIKELESYRQPYIGKEKNTQNYAEKVYRTYTCSFQRTKIHLLCGIIMQHQVLHSPRRCAKLHFQAFLSVNTGFEPMIAH